MLTIMLYGELGKQFGRVHQRDVRSAGEAMRALAATLPGFREAAMPGRFHLLRAGKEALDVEQLSDPQSHQETLRVVPVVQGAGRTILPIIVGAALFVAAPGIGAAIGGKIGAFVGKAASSIGASLALSGVSNLLFAPPKPDTFTSQEANNLPSFSFNGAINTTQQGYPVPVLYGELVVGSQVVSAGLEPEQLL